MRRSGLIIGTVFTAMTLSPSVFALDGITVEGGDSSESTNVWRVGVQFDFGRTLWQSDGGGAVLTGFWDAGYTHWSGLDAETISLAPVFTLNFPANGAVTPFIEGGIGPAVFTETNLADRRDLGSKFQFEDRIGAGLRFASGAELGVRWYHYSNAGIKQPNSGINKSAVYFRYPL
ncbi:MAG TPA: acyloxyacyl hydrolase [Pseudomonas sp.]|jgi:lipid A 3-O-deacylase|nr:acyloxyacyl hydrolase [Halopseudomonas aestusnigri]HBT55653.1 acyloxyacyl hydrolase [Pseudomonas sp.]|tara:strand:+ start:448 stop:972 length:525 start_codon:yes stop_codon:yes gene_type:complete